MKRLLLCSMSVPWPRRQLLGAYHVDQAKGLRELGVDTELFSPAPCLPTWAAALHAKCRAHLERPDRYRIRGVTIRTPRVPFVFTAWARRRGAHLAPGLLATWARASLRRSLLAAIERHRPDALLVHSMLPWASVIEDVAERTGLPYGFIEHSAEDVLRLRQGTRLARFYTEAARKARVVFVVGAQMVDHLRRGLQLENVTYLPNGADIPDEITIDAHRGRPAGGREPGPLVLSAGHYYPRKGFEVLVRAFARVARTHPTARLQIVTAAPPGLHDLVSRLGLTERVELVPPLPRRELQALMIRADVFALASWSESFALVGIEAMASRTPVVLTEDCGLARMITPANDGTPSAHGWVVKPRCEASLATALNDALADRRRLRTIGDNGRALVRETFTWRRNAETIVESFGWSLPVAAS
ncbi:MAG: glycosyltransferase [Planctomycetota bacterium]|jgi:glycosyltransferase involved in cell wall biosynthesis